MICAQPPRPGIRIDALPRPSLIDWRNSPRERTRRKYNNEPTTVNGVLFDSKAEARRYVDLLWLEKAGHVSDIHLQFEFELLPEQARPSGGRERAAHYIADFVYFDARKGDWVVEDVKGASPDLWVLKRKLMLHLWGIEVQEVRA